MIMVKIAIFAMRIVMIAMDHWLMNAYLVTETNIIMIKQVIVLIAMDLV